MNNGKRRGRGPQKNHAKSSAYAIAMQLKRREAVELRRQGYSLQQIADQLGWATANSAWTAIKKVMREMVQEPATELRKIEMARLEELFKESRPYAVRRTIKVQKKVGHKMVEEEVVVPPDPAYVEKCRNIIKQQCELFGLEAPKKTETRMGGTSDGVPIFTANATCLTIDDLDTLPLEMRRAMYELLVAKEERQAKAALPAPASDNKGEDASQVILDPSGE